MKRRAILLTEDEMRKVRLESVQRTNVGLIARRKDKKGSVLIRDNMTWIRKRWLLGVWPIYEKWSIVFDGEPRPIMVGKTEHKVNDAMEYRNMLSPAPYDSQLFDKALRSRIFTRHMNSGMDFKTMVILILSVAVLVAIFRSL